MKRIIINVYGLVQGVFFRYTTRKVARRLGLTGYVKNMPDGSVYIEAEGSEDKLKELLEFTKKGPKHAQVEKTDYEFKDSQNQFNDFIAE
ncbi:MAG: acylphosphatase [Promethearchaeota archaeon]|nr:MAG: acylphosphatase [Candidatus Lokiarchaeota archaeon]